MRGIANPYAAAVPAAWVRLHAVCTQLGWPYRAFTTPSGVCGVTVGSQTRSVKMHTVDTHDVGTITVPRML